jgi:hypothetical protein
MELTRAAPILDELRPLVAAVKILSESRFSFAGTDVDLAAPGRKAVPPLQPHANRLVESLLALLYEHGYCRRFHGTLSEQEPMPDLEATLLEDLTAANAGSEGTDRGWQIEAVLSSGQVVARKGSVTHTYFPGEFVVEGLRGQAPAPGAPMRANLCHESWTVQPGFYMAYGSAVADDHDDRTVVRFYWNVAAEGAAALLREVTATLNRFELPFRFKCPLFAAAYTRRDSAVLYLAARHAHLGAMLVERIWNNTQELLRPDTPLFTKPLARGVAFAEDPGSGESFGTQRVRLLAEALWDGFSGGVSSEEARITSVGSYFSRQGVRLEAPWLCSFGRPGYDFTAIESFDRR